MKFDHLPARLGPTLAVLLLVGPGCGVPHVERTLEPGALLREPAKPEPRFLKAHLHDGSVLLFSDWRYDEETDRIVGPAQRFDLHRARVDSGQVAIEVREVALVESNVIQTSDRLAGLAVLFGLSLAGTVLCATHPKSCFGSCPTFYVGGSEGPELRAEGFSAAVAPSLEATDRDALGRVPVDGGRIVLTMKNEAWETHVVRSAELLVFPEVGPGEEVAATGDGAFLRVAGALPPRSCSDGTRDWASEVQSLDGVWRAVGVDSTDLSAREELLLEFAPVPEGPLALLVSARQSLVSTYLFYQALAWMGTEAGRWIARLERSDPAERALLEAPGRRLGRIEVEARSGGDWIPVGACGETGPLATDTWALRLPAGLERDRGLPLELRVRSARGLWRFDRFALARVAAEARPVRLDPAEVWTGGKRDEHARSRLLDPERTIVTYPGDALDLVYVLPEEAVPRDAEIPAFLDSRGYYLEWMRDEWLEEEDPARAARLFLDPAGALRELAPEFHAAEAELERSFWESRYAVP